MSTFPVVYSGPFCSHGSWPKANSSLKWPQVLPCILLYLLYLICVQYDQSSTWSIYFTGLQTKTWEDSKPIGFLWISCVLRHMDACYDQVLTNNPENLSGPCKQQWLSFLGHFSALTLLTNSPAEQTQEPEWEDNPFSLLWNVSFSLPFCRYPILRGRAMSHTW